MTLHDDLVHQIFGALVQVGKAVDFLTGQRGFHAIKGFGRFLMGTVIGGSDGPYRRFDKWIFRQITGFFAHNMGFQAQ